MALEDYNVTLKKFLLPRDSVVVYYYSIAHDLCVHGGVDGNRFTMSQKANRRDS